MSLERDMQQVLFEMRWLLPWGGTTRYDSDSGHAAAGSRIPAGVRLDGGSEEMPHERWRRKWDTAFSLTRKETVYREACAELEQWRKRPPVVTHEETITELEARMIREGDGWSVQDVANHFHCTPTFVRRVRLLATVDMTSGHARIIKPAPSDMDEALRARELTDRGLSERQIRMILGCGGSKLRRLLGRAA